MRNGSRALAAIAAGWLVVAGSTASAGEAPSVQFEVNDVPGAENPTQRLDVTFAGHHLEGPSAAYISIETERDFNGDGISDALISTSQGGNCCPDTYMFVAVVKGKLVSAEIEPEWGTVEVVERNGKPLVRMKTSDATYLYAFDGAQVVKAGAVAKLAALVEVEGVGAMYGGDETEKSLSYDLDADGRPETIHCDIWPRWGTLVNCALPLPGGAAFVLDASCERLGVLETRHHGRHDLVCGNDTVITFDGKTWKSKS